MRTHGGGGGGDDDDDDDDDGREATPCLCGSRSSTDSTRRYGVSVVTS